MKLHYEIEDLDCFFRQHRNKRHIEETPPQFFFPKLVSTKSNNTWVSVIFLEMGS